ncbi:MAG: outer membrane beta-barrel protein [Rhodocyclaceae bacterium]|nr:outer membrane beta-barrel protein [Rhodocyclaceae bacterium]
MRIPQMKLVALAMASLASQVVLAESDATQQQAVDKKTTTSETVPLLFGSPVPATTGAAATNPAQQVLSPEYSMAPSAAVAAQGRGVRFANGVFVKPAVTTALSHNDNLIGVETGKIATTIFTIRPEIVAELKRREDVYSLSYAGNYGWNWSSSADNFMQHLLNLQAENVLDARLRTKWAVGYQISSDPRGSTANSGATEPNRWRAPQLSAGLTYGATGAQGRLAVDGSWMQKRYDNNRALTEQSDVDIASVSTSFYYRFMPKTSALVELRNTWSDYTMATSLQDNTDTRIYGGLTWEATAKTTGSIRLGRAYKNFETQSATYKDASRMSWEAQVEWAPLTYSTVQMAATRGFADSTGVGSYLINTGLNVNWQHRWSQLYASNVAVGRVMTTYGNSVREDQVDTYGFGFSRVLSRYSALGLNWTHTTRDVTGAVGFNFERNVTMLSLQSSL